MTPAMDNRYQLDVTVKTAYLEQRSQPGQERFAFAYTITINNRGTLPATLLRRHWIITDANEKVQEVEGEGVIGESPTIPPGESFSYTSGALIATEFGHMSGSYEMLSSDGTIFDARIPAFTLAHPYVLN